MSVKNKQRQEAPLSSRVKNLGQRQEEKQASHSEGFTDERELDGGRKRVQVVARLPENRFLCYNSEVLSALLSYNKEINGE